MEAFDKNLRNAVVDVFTKIQENVSSHQKNLQTLKAVYKSKDLEEFVNEFVRCLEMVFARDHKLSKARHKLILTFAAKFCSEVLIEYEKDSDGSDDDEENPFLEKIIDKTLVYTDLADVDCRYHSCYFIFLLLDSIGNSVHLSSKLCDNIQDSLLERLQDSVLGIRITCIGALSRLQDPNHPTNECPVITSFVLVFEDPHPLVRKEVISKIAFTHVTAAKIIEHIRDVDSTVRVAVYNRIGGINPRTLRITQRQHILLCGLEEEQKSVKTAFQNILLLKWLKCYDDDLVAFLRSLKLDADDEDVKETQFILEGILKIFFKMLPLDKIVDTLPLDERKLVPLDKITLEIASYWYNLIMFLQSDEKLASEVDSLLVELSLFCEYIENYIKINSNKMNTENWQYFDFQGVLYTLFSLALNSDFTDEVGRAKLQKLVSATLVNTKLEGRVIGRMLEIYKKFFPDVKRQCDEICKILSDIREPTCIEHVAATPEIYVLTTNQKFEIAQLKTKLYTLEDAKTQALADNQFSEAERLHKEMEALRVKIQEISTPPVRAPEPVVTKELKTDTPTICRCLDILIAFLENTRIRKLPAPLRSCLLEFVKPSMSQLDMTAYGRIFRIVGLYSIIDKGIAMDELKNICSPLLAYRHGKIDKTCLIATMQGISDIIRVHGPEVFGEDPDTTFDTNSTRRRLYRGTQLEEALNDSSNISGGLVMDILLSLMDEEDDDIRHCATKSISKIVMHGLYVGPSLLARLVLKWLNPYIERHDSKMQQILGYGIMQFASQIGDSSSIFEKAIIPILCSVGNAPITSPLADIDPDHMCTLLSKLTKVRCNNFNTVHKNLAFSLLHEIKRKSTLKCVFILSKMVLFLDPPQMDDETTIRELLNDVDPAQDAIVDRQAIRNLKKYKDILNSLLNREELPPVTNAEDSADKENEDPEQQTVTNLQQISELQTHVSNMNISTSTVIDNGDNGESNNRRLVIGSDLLLNGSRSESMETESNASQGNDSMVSNSSFNSSGTEGKRKRGRPRKRTQSDDTTLNTILERSGEASKLSEGSDQSDVSRTSRRSSRNQTQNTQSARKKRIQSSDSQEDTSTPLRKSARKRVKKVR